MNNLWEGAFLILIRLSHEWQAYISRTHSLRKTFISVKGIYYQVILADMLYIGMLDLSVFHMLTIPCFNALTG